MNGQLERKEIRGVLRTLLVRTKDEQTKASIRTAIHVFADEPDPSELEAPLGDGWRCLGLVSVRRRLLRLADKVLAKGARAPPLLVRLHERMGKVAHHVDGHRKHILPGHNFRRVDRQHFAHCTASEAQRPDFQADFRCA
jgi:hypothetical protein